MSINYEAMHLQMQARNYGDRQRAMDLKCLLTTAIVKRRKAHDVAKS